MSEASDLPSSGRRRRLFVWIVVCVAGATGTAIDLIYGMANRSSALGAFLFLGGYIATFAAAKLGARTNLTFKPLMAATLAGILVSIFTQYLLTPALATLQPSNTPRTFAPNAMAHAIGMALSWVAAYAIAWLMLRGANFRR